MSIWKAPFLFLTSRCPSRSHQKNWSKFLTPSTHSPQSSACDAASKRSIAFSAARNIRVGPTLYQSTKAPKQKKTTTLVQPLGLTQERRRLEEKLRRLKQPPQPPTSQADICMETSPQLAPIQVPQSSVHVDPLDAFDSELPQYDPSDQPEEEPRRQRRVLPNQTAHKRYDTWAATLPRLVDPLLAYVTKSTGQIPERVVQLEATCWQGCVKKSYQVLCLFQDCMFYFLSSLLIPLILDF